MFKALVLSGAVALAASSTLSAQSQSVRWNDRPASSWDDEAPIVRVAIEGTRGVGYGQPVRVRFEVSDNAYVTVVRVDDEGRTTILFPNSRTQRSAVRGKQIYYARNPRMGGDYSFISTDRMGGGYVFAIASYAPLDFTSFENRDFDRGGGYSQFTVANRNSARRPDVLIDRFAARVLWSVDTPYDYDVDYYAGFGDPALNAYALCGLGAYGSYYGYGSRPIGSRTFLAQLSSFERASYPYYSMCSNWYNRLQCYSWLAYSMYSGCLSNGFLIARVPSVPPTNGPVGGIPVDSNAPNENVIRGGLFTPTPVPVPADPDNTLARESGGSRFDQVKEGGDLEGIMSIPARATRKMKDEDARRERGDAEATTRSGFDRATTAEKPEKGATADASSVQPPSREPTKAKGTADPVRESTRSRTGFGSTGRTNGGTTSAPRDRDMGTRPSAPANKPAAAPSPSLGGTSTSDKKKPPQD